MRRKQDLKFFALPASSMDVPVPGESVKHLINLCTDFLTKNPEPKIPTAPPICDDEDDFYGDLYHANTHPATVVADIKTLLENDLMGWTNEKKLELVGQRISDDSVKHIMTKNSNFEIFINAITNLIKALFTFNFKAISKQPEKTEVYNELNRTIVI